MLPPRAQATLLLGLELGTRTKEEGEDEDLVWVVQTGDREAIVEEL